MTTLYRAAPAENPYFGHLSYWTHSESFARRFRLWLDEHFKDKGPYVIYRADVDLTDILDVPFGAFLNSARVSQFVREHGAELAGSRYEWLSFYEGVFEGNVTRQYVYLGHEPIRAEVLPET